MIGPLPLVVCGTAAALYALGRRGKVRVWREVSFYSGVVVTFVVLKRPSVALAVQSTAVGVWHVPQLYDAAARSEWIHVLQHVSFVAPALVFWGALLDAPPVRARIDHLHRSIWFAAAMVPSWILAIVLAFASAPLYTAYPSLTDQQVAAGVMWVPGSLTYFIAAFVAFYRWLEPGQAEPRPEELSWT